MTSQAQAALPLSGVRALVFLGFPLHSAGRPSDERANHLFNVSIPMLFLQGTRRHPNITEAARTTRHSRNSQAISGCGSFLPRCTAHRTKQCGGQSRDAGYARVLAAKCGLGDYRLDPISGRAPPGDARRGGHSCFGRRDEMSKDLGREAFSNFVRALAFASRKHSQQRRKDVDASLP
jgi:hypothetical protein